MHILYMCGRELDYTRNKVLLRAFCRLGTVDVIGEEQPGSMLPRIGRVFIRALTRLLTQKYDMIFVGFYGHLLMLPVGILSHSPVLFDAFISTYDTLCFDRASFKPLSLIGRLAFWLDQSACRMADIVLLDTQSHVEYFLHTFNLSPDKVNCLPVGCNEDIFFPRPKNQKGNITYVLYYSTYLPLHGVETIVRAAALLKAESSLHFKIIGTGPDYTRVQKLADNLELSNIVFMPPVLLETLATEIAFADICLGGHFGVSDKSRRVIPGKIYQILAMGRPLVAADTPANRELLVDGVTACLCPQNNPEALAATIMKLHLDTTMRNQLAVQGRALYLERCSEAVITDHLHQLISELIGKQ